MNFYGGLQVSRMQDDCVAVVPTVGHSEKIGNMAECATALQTGLPSTTACSHVAAKQLYYGHFQPSEVQWKLHSDHVWHISG